MFTVHWADRALKELEALWFDATRRTTERIVEAIKTLEARLMSNAEEFGESRFGQWRIGFQAPIAILFKVNREKRSVRIAHVMLYGK